MNQLKELQDQMRKARNGIKEAKLGVVLMAKDLCENKLRFGYEIDDKKAKNVVDMLIQLLEKENEFLNLEDVYSSAMNQFQDNRELETDKEQKLEDIEGYIKNLKIKEYIESCMEAKRQNDMFEPKNDVYYKQVMSLLYDQNEEEDNGGDIEVSVKFTIPIDPISTKQIEDPIRSIHCKHVYDREAFEEFIKGKLSIQCPKAGCMAKNISKNDVYNDERLRLMIELEKEKEKGAN